MKPTSYPLHYPPQVPRTPDRKRTLNYRFARKLTIAKARDSLLRELKRLDAENVVISSNVPIRNDGLPYSRAATPDDPGVAVYFDREGESYVLPCDRWSMVAQNIWAIYKYLDCLRPILEDRWGVGNVKQQLAGFRALPEAEKPWWQVLEVAENAGIDAIEAAYRQLAKRYHPDLNPNAKDSWHQLQRAYKEARISRVPVA